NARTLLLAAALLLRARPRLGTAPEAELRISQLGWALPSVEPLMAKRIGLAFVPGGLQFQDPLSETRAINVPSTDPAVVELEWEAPGGARRVLSEADAGVLVPLEGDPALVTITTLSSDQYRVTAKPAVSGTPRSRAVAPPDRLLQACLQVEPLGHAEP